MNAALAEGFGVPMVFVSGNSDLDDEIRALEPAPVFVATKSVLGPTAAICAPPSRTKKLIADGVETALRRSWIRSEVIERETTIEIETYRREQAHRGSRLHGVELVGDSRMRVSASNVHDAYRRIWHACTMALDHGRGSTRIEQHDWRISRSSLLCWWTGYAGTGCSART